MSAITPRKLLASTAVAIVFASQAGAAGLITDDIGVVNMRGAFSESLAKAAKDDVARLHAGAFLKQLEGTLGSRTEKPQVVDYPKPVSANMLRTLAIVPPQGMEQSDIPVCAEQNNKVIGLWNITAKGAVTPVTNWTGPVVSEAPTAAACKYFLRAARDDIAAKYATMQQQQPPAAEATKKPQVLGMAPQQ